MIIEFDDDPRGYLEHNLRLRVPKLWKIVPFTRSIDKIAVPTLLIKLQEITRNSSAPQAERVVEFVLTLVNPKQDISRAEAELDDQITTVLNALDDSPRIAWTSCQKVQIDELYLGYDVRLSIAYAITKEK